MSHQPERKQKDCLNCGTIVQGRYCHICGQENIEIHQGFFSLTTHFIYDIFHFDGKFFDTLKLLFTRPGLVAKRYVQGKRVSYLDPIRMYLFTSAIFFLVFFSIQNLKINRDGFFSELTSEDRFRLARSLERRMKNDPSDTSLRQQIALLNDTTRQLTLRDLGMEDDYKIISFSGNNYKSLQHYDSIQQALPPKERDGWFSQRLIRQSIKVNEKYGRSEDGANQYLNALLHKLPYLLFVSLPFFALLLKLLYVRRKHFMYSDHAVFTLYHYIFTFILLLLVFLLNAVKNWTGFTFISWIVTAIYLIWPIYLYIQMKRFYGQGHFRTAVKFILLNLLGILVMILLMIIFFVLSIFQI